MGTNYTLTQDRDRVVTKSGITYWSDGTYLRSSDQHGNSSQVFVDSKNNSSVRDAVVCEKGADSVASAVADLIIDKQTIWGRDCTVTYKKSDGTDIVWTPLIDVSDSPSM